MKIISKFTIYDLRFTRRKQFPAGCCGVISRHPHPFRDVGENPLQRIDQSQIANRKSRAFTLIELLIVIAIIVILAALAMPVFNMVTQKALIQRATSERDVLEAAIERYHTKFGYYPPSSAIGTPPANGALNQLYYELAGTTITTNSGGTLTFTTLDNSSSLSTNVIVTDFGVTGIMNCTKGSGDDQVVAQNFLPSLRPGQIGTATNGTSTTYVIATAVHTEPFYHPPLPGFTTLAGDVANPWRYVYPGTNNPNSYDLWVQVYVGGKTDLICNWFDQPKINYPMP